MTAKAHERASETKRAVRSGGDIVVVTGKRQSPKVEDLRSSNDPDDSSVPLYSKDVSIW